MKKINYAMVILVIILTVFCVSCSNDSTDENVTAIAIEPSASTSNEETKASAVDDAPAEAAAPAMVEAPAEAAAPPAVIEKDAEWMRNSLYSESLQYPSQNEEWKYNVYETFVEIVSYLGTATEVVIPNEIDGLPVKSISIRFNDLADDEICTLETITIPETMCYIDSSTFFKMPLKRVYFAGENKIFFGEMAFAQCKNLEEVNSILDHLAGDTVPERMFSGGVEYDDNGRVTDFYRKHPQGNQATEIDIPDTITKIGENAFCGMEQVQRIDLNNVEIVGYNAFAFCGEQADSVSLNAPKVEEISSRAFYSSSSNMERIELPSIKKLGTRAIGGAKIIDIGENIKEIGDFNLASEEFYFRSRDNDVYLGQSDSVGPKDTVKIYGYKGSRAAAFAAAHDLAFIPLD